MRNDYNKAIDRKTNNRFEWDGRRWVDVRSDLDRLDDNGCFVGRRVET